MKKKRGLVIALALLMALCNPANVYAENVSGNETVTVSENEEAEETPEVPEDVVSGDEENAEVPQEEESDSTETVSENNTEENEEAVSGDEEDAEVPQEEESDSTETVSENNTEENEEAVSENSIESDKPSAVMSLTTEMMQDKRELGASLSEFKGMVAGVDYRENQAVFYADTTSYAKKVADGYGGEILYYEDQVAVMQFAESVETVLEWASDEEVQLPAVYPNYIYTIEVMDADAEGEVPQETVGGENEESADNVEIEDPDYSQQYYHTGIGSADAWNNGVTGKGVVVAVIDSGIDKNHPDLKANILEASNKCSTAYNDAADNNGHGTHVAGIIAAAKNTVGGVGVAYEAKILSIKAMEHNPLTNSISGSTADIIKAIDYAVSKGARVINMSMGRAGAKDVLFQDAVNRAVNKGVVVVVAAGDGNINIASTTYVPACLDNVITVGALDTSGTSKASFANYGKGIIDIGAPGEKIYSTVPMSVDTEDGEKDGYQYMSGTSMATPIVSGVAALILSANKDLGKDKAAVDTVEGILENTAFTLVLWDTDYAGKGLVKANKAVAKVTSVIKDPVITATDGVTEGKKTQVTTGVTKISISTEVKEAGEVVTGATIYYTTDGKTPTVNSTKYTAPFTVSATKAFSVKAIAVYEGKKSAVTTVSYNVRVPVTSVTVAGKGNIDGVGAGKKLTMVATVIGPQNATSKKVEWKITDSRGNETDKATISTSGVVTAARGITEQITLKVRATSVSDPKVYGEKTITVYPLTTAVKQSTDSNRNAITLTIPKNKETVDYQWKVTQEPVKAMPLVYSSSKASVVEVNNSGKITAKAAGTATITAAAMDGSGKKVTLKVTVTKAVTSLTVSSKNGTSNLASGKSLSMIAKTNDGASNQKVSWKVTTTNGADTSAATITTSGVLKAKTVTEKTTVKVWATSQADETVKNYKEVVIYPAISTLSAEKSLTLGTAISGSLEKTYTLNVTATGATGTPLKSYTFTSSKPEVATVDNSGKITAQGVGKATITVAANDNSGKKVSCTVTVVNPVTSVVITPKNGRNFVASGKKLTLVGVTNTDATNRKLAWSSSNNDVATVSNGVVTAKKGITSKTEVTITATATDGSGIEKAYTVYVFAPVEALGISFPEEGSFYTRYTRTVNLGYQYSLPDYVWIGENTVLNDSTLGSSGISISCNNYNVLQFCEKDGEIYIVPVNKGSAKIVYTTMDGTNKKVEYCFVVK